MAAAPTPTRLPQSGTFNWAARLGCAESTSSWRTARAPHCVLFVILGDSIIILQTHATTEANQQTGAAVESSVRRGFLCLCRTELLPPSPPRPEPTHSSHVKSFGSFRPARCPCGPGVLPVQDGLLRGFWYRNTVTWNVNTDRITLKLSTLVTLNVSLKGHQFCVWGEVGTQILPVRIMER